MPEWWTYTLSDFLLFSPRTYYRLIQRHNEAVWPAHLVTLILGLVIAASLARPSAQRGRVVSGILALIWIWVAWAFVWRRYATINWAAGYLAWLLGLEALLLAWIGVIRGRLAYGWTPDATGFLGIGLIGLSVLVYPMLAPLLGRGWHQAEVFGIAPDPTAIATVGLMFLVGGRARSALLAAPALWCLAGGLTLWAMHSPEAWLLLGTALSVPVGIGAKRRPTQGARGRPAP